MTRSRKEIRDIQESKKTTAVDNEVVYKQENSEAWVLEANEVLKNSGIYQNWDSLKTVEKREAISEELSFFAFENPIKKEWAKDIIQSFIDNDNQLAANWMNEAQTFVLNKEEPVEKKEEVVEAPEVVEEEKTKTPDEQLTDVEKQLDSISDEKLEVLIKSLLSDFSNNANEELEEAVHFMLEKAEKRGLDISIPVSTCQLLFNVEKKHHDEKVDKQKTTIQTVIFSKERFKNKEQADKWLKDNDFKPIKPLDETSVSYRSRQKSPGLFREGSFRTITLTDGVKAVIGILKTEKNVEKNIEPEPKEEIQKFIDPYMIKQDGPESKKFVVQRHFSDMWSEKERLVIKEKLNEVQKLFKDDVAKAQLLLDHVWSDYKLHKLSTSLKNIQRAIKLAGGDFNCVLSEMSKLLDNCVPKVEDLEMVMSNIVNIGSVHIDLRFEKDKSEIVTWMLETPGLVVQTLNGKLLPVRRDKFNQNEKGELIDANKKPLQKPVWLNLLSSEKPIFSIDNENKSVDEFRFVDEGKIIYGCQKSDFHEYFLFFNKNKELSGRWVAFKDISLDEQWSFQRTFKQKPYIVENDQAFTRALTKAENGQLLWNIDSLEALDKIGFDYSKKEEILECEEDAVEKSFDKTIVRINVDKAAEQEERMVYGVVLEPNTIDAHGEFVDSETIRKAAHLYLEYYQQKGFQHGRSDKYPQFPDGLRLMESYIAPVNMTINGQKIKKGTWLMAMRVDHDELWNDIKNGFVTGFSILGVARKRESKRKN